MNKKKIIDKLYKRDNEIRTEFREHENKIYQEGSEDIQFDKGYIYALELELNFIHDLIREILRD